MSEERDILLVTTEQIPKDLFIKEMFEMALYVHRHWSKVTVENEANDYFEALENFKKTITNEANAVLNVKIETTHYKTQNPENHNMSTGTIQLVISGTPVILEEYQEDAMQSLSGSSGSMGGGIGRGK